MKIFKLIAFLFVGIFCLQNVYAQTVDEVINNYLNAIGGKEKLNQLKTIKMTGNINVQGTDVGVVVTVSNGIGVRTDIEVPGMDVGYRIITPTKGWVYLPFQGQTGPVDMSDDELKSGQGMLDLQTPLMNYKEKGHSVELAGKETIKGTECYKLIFTNKNGKVSTIYIDTKNYYRVKTIATTSVNGQEMKVETEYSDFRKTPEGYVFAYSQTNPNGIIAYTSIEINKPVDENIFVAK